MKEWMARLWKGWPMLALAALVVGASGSRSLPLAAAPGFGQGSLNLIDHRGHPVSERDLTGAPALVFFGYTSCPDVCPTAMARMAAVLERLDDIPAGRLRAIFVTLDPERDSPERLASFIDAFDPRIMGLSGTPSEVAAAARAFRVYHRRVAESGQDDYRIDHSAAIFLAGDGGGLRAAFGPEYEAEAIAVEIRRLLAS